MAAPKSIAAWRLGEMKPLATWLVSSNVSPAYAVQISTALGDVKAFTPFDKSYVDQVVLALDSVTIKQG